MANGDKVNGKQEKKLGRGPRLRRKRLTHKVGLPPGSYREFASETPSKIIFTKFNLQFCEVQELTSLEGVGPVFSEGVQWIHFIGFPSKKDLITLEEKFQIHALSLEDIFNIFHRPKFEQYDHHSHFIGRYVQDFSPKAILETYQLNLFICQDVVVSIQDSDVDQFSDLRKRIIGNKGKLRGQKADYLFYSLLDTTVDNYFVILQDFDLQMDELEVELMDKVEGATMNRLYRLRRELSIFRKIVYPMREAIGQLIRQRAELLSPASRFYLKDVNDHIIQISESLDSYLENMNHLTNFTYSEKSDQSNNVIKVLAVVSVVFLPLNLISGIFGMNFVHLPFADWPFGFYFVLGVMLLFVLSQLFMFQRRHWF